MRLFAQPRTNWRLESLKKKEKKMKKLFLTLTLLGVLTTTAATYLVKTDGNTTVITKLNKTNGTENTESPSSEMVLGSKRWW